MRSRTQGGERDREQGGVAAATTRRRFLVGVGAGLVALPLAGARSLREARTRGDALRVLSEGEGQTLDALGDTLLPGAAEAGVAHYVDSQLASTTPLLMIKYVDFPMPYADFYRQGLAALDALARARHGAAFAALAAEQKDDVVREISATTPGGWSGPPAPLFYFVTRNDALDVVYGTEEGFAKLEVPYRPHIAPPARW